jgi:hypothetical protein
MEKVKSLLKKITCEDQRRFGLILNLDGSIEVEYLYYLDGSWPTDVAKAVALDSTSGRTAEGWDGVEELPDPPDSYKIIGGGAPALGWFSIVPSMLTARDLPASILTSLQSFVGRTIEDEEAERLDLLRAKARKRAEIINAAKKNAVKNVRRVMATIR